MFFRKTLHAPKRIFIFLQAPCYPKRTRKHKSFFVIDKILYFQTRIPSDVRLWGCISEFYNSINIISLHSKQRIFAALLNKSWERREGKCDRCICPVFYYGETKKNGSHLKQNVMILEVDKAPPLFEIVIPPCSGVNG